MPDYKVKQGDYLSKIAKQHGFADYLTIWDHPNNAELKKKRKNPNVIYPGDVLFIPEREGKVESGATEQKHRFKVKGKPLMLRIVLKDYNDKPIANANVDLHVEGNVYALTTDSKGKIEKEIPATAESGRLVFIDPDTPFDEMVLKIGHLDPIEEISGWKARLNNLGYNAGPIDDEKTEQLRSAIEEFQCDYFKDLSQVDGECGPKTQAKLKEVHGC
jgi:N-acetylmuramoyl-L-alanine amidase